MSDIESLVLDFLRTEPTLTGVQFCTKLPDYSPANPWPKDLVHVYRVPFTSEIDLDYQHVDLYLDKALFHITCYSASQGDAADLWKKVRKKFRTHAAPNFVKSTVITPGAWIADTSVQHNHLDSYVGRIVVTTIHGRE